MTKQPPLDALSRGFFVIPSFQLTPEPTGLPWLASGPPPQQNVIAQWIPAFAGKTVGPMTGRSTVILAKARIQISCPSQPCSYMTFLDSSEGWNGNGAGTPRQSTACVGAGF